MKWGLLPQFANIAESMNREVNTVEVLGHDVVGVASVGGWLGFGRKDFGIVEWPPWGGPYKGREEGDFFPSNYCEMGGQFCSRAKHME